MADGTRELALSYIERRGRIETPMDAVLWVMAKLRRRWRADGAWVALSHLYRQPMHRVIEPGFVEPLVDWRLGIETRGYVDEETLGLPAGGSAYVGIRYRQFEKMLRWAQVDPREEVFVDYGSGKGRAVILAARHPFRRVMGVEYSAALHALAERNVRSARSRGKLLCENVELITADAGEWALPEDVSLIYFYNPFRGELLERALGRIRASLEARPRRARLLYGNPVHFEPIADRFGWLVKKTEYQTYYQYKCAIYDCRV